MKFTTADGTRFEISNLKELVITDVRVIIEPATKEHPARIKGKERIHENGTRVWSRFETKKGTRWLKFRYPGVTPMFHDPAKAVTGCSPATTQEKIQQAMRTPGKHVWFSEHTCNIQVITNYEEVQELQKKREKSPMRKGTVIVITGGKR